MSENRRHTLLSIFAGIGGFDLAFNEAGFRTLAFVEWQSIKQHVLREWFPGIPIFGDIDQFDCREFLRTFGRPDVIAGGVPCQAASLLGTRLGTADARWKWPQAIRLVGELRPRYFVAENPPAILSLESGRAFNGIVSEMAALGYDGWWDVIPAAAFGAGHWRERLCIVFADAARISERITPNEAESISGSGRAWDEPSGANHERVFSADNHSEWRRLGTELVFGTQKADARQRPACYPQHEYGGQAGIVPAHADSERRAEAGRSVSDGESRDEFRAESSANSGPAFSSDANNSGSQGHARNGIGSGGRADSKRSVAAPGLPDLRGRVTGPRWWYEVVAGIPCMPAKEPADAGMAMLVPGLPNRLVEAAALCIGDSVVPQAWVPIAKTIAEQLK